MTTFKFRSTRGADVLINGVISGIITVNYQGDLIAFGDLSNDIIEKYIEAENNNPEQVKIWNKDIEDSIKRLDKMIINIGN